MGISGSLATAAFNPRAVMAALGMAAPKTADASVLKSASFSAAIQGDEQKILLKNIRVKLDDSTLTGEAGISDLASLRQYARLTLDAWRCRWLATHPGTDGDVGKDNAATAQGSRRHAHCLTRAE